MRLLERLDDGHEHTHFWSIQQVAEVLLESRGGFVARRQDVAEANPSFEQRIEHFEQEPAALRHERHVPQARDARQRWRKRRQSCPNAPQPDSIWPTDAHSAVRGDLLQALLACQADWARLGEPARQRHDATHSQAGTLLGQQERRVGWHGQDDTVGHLRQGCQTREAGRAEDLFVLVLRVDRVQPPDELRLQHIRMHARAPPASWRRADNRHRGRLEESFDLHSASHDRRFHVCAEITPLTPDS